MNYSKQFIYNAYRKACGLPLGGSRLSGRISDVGSPVPATSNIPKLSYILMFDELKKTVIVLKTQKIRTALQQ